MQIQFTSHDADADALRDVAQKRLRRVFARFVDMVRRAWRRRDDDPRLLRRPLGGAAS